MSNKPVDRNGTILLVFCIEEAAHLKKELVGRFPTMYPNGIECHAHVMCQGEPIANAFDLSADTPPNTLMVVVDVSHLPNDVMGMVASRVHWRVKYLAKTYGLNHYSKIITTLFTGKWVVEEDQLIIEPDEQDCN